MDEHARFSTTRTTSPKIEITTENALPDWAEKFYRAKKTEGVSAHTLAFYKQQLGHFLKFADAQVITRLDQVKPDTIRDFLIHMEETGHNAGGQHAAYRVLKTFLIWYELEAEPDGWRNPIKKVKAPKLAEEPLDPVEVVDVQRMVRTCDSSFLGRRNKAILLFLLDSGVRARELLALTLADVNLSTGAVTIRQGKGKKSRTVIVGMDTRKAVKAYLKERTDDLEALWLTEDRDAPLQYEGLRGLLIRHAELAKVKPPGAHDFRRAFALTMLRNGVDILTIARLMGHTSIKTLRRYLAHNEDDLQAAHAKGSPVDRAKGKG